MLGYNAGANRRDRLTEATWQACFESSPSVSTCFWGCAFSESVSSDRKLVNGFASRGSPALGPTIWLPRSLCSVFSRLARLPWPPFVRSSRGPRFWSGVCSLPVLSFALLRGHRSVLTGPITSCTRPSLWSLRFWVFWAVGNTSAAPEGLCQAQQSPAKTKRPQRKLPGRTIEKLSTRAVHSWPLSTELFPRPAGVSLLYSPPDGSP